MATGDDLTGPPRLPTGAQSRAQSFSTGLAGDPDSATATSASQNPGLSLNGQQFMEQIPGRVIQTSTLQNPMPGLNGISAADYEQRMLPGLSQPLPSADGSSLDTYSKSLLMRLQGREI